jgi:GNAT superfamily N-acetyltransferase
MRAGGPSPETIAIRRLVDPDDPALGDYSELLHATFGDPDTVLELECMQHFLAQAHALQQPPHPYGERVFSIIVAEHDGAVLGGALFSYVPATNCGFSEYLVARKAQHGRGLGRRLFDFRRAILDAQARQAGEAACRGLFIEADNPRRTPPAVLAQERQTAIDAATRLQIFAHFGFWRVDMAYVQPPLGPGKEPVTYLDLLFAPWSEDVQSTRCVPVAWVLGTLGPVWASWAPERVQADLAVLHEQVGQQPLRLIELG